MSSLCQKPPQGPSKIASIVHLFLCTRQRVLVQSLQHSLSWTHKLGDVSSHNDRLFYFLIHFSFTCHFDTASTGLRTRNTTGCAFRKPAGKPVGNIAGILPFHSIPLIPFPLALDWCCVSQSWSIQFTHGPDRFSFLRYRDAQQPSVAPHSSLYGSPL